MGRPDGFPPRLACAKQCSGPSPTFDAIAPETTNAITPFPCLCGGEPCARGYTTSTSVSCRSGFPGSDCLITTRLEGIEIAGPPAILRDSRDNAVAASKDRSEF
jgi:hypothetical protein